MVITGNYVHSIYSSFTGNSKLFYMLHLFYLCTEILAVSSLFKCLIAIKCSESRVETLQIFLIGKKKSGND